MPDTMSLSEAQEHISSVVLVGKADLQEKILAGHIGEKFHLDVMNVRLDPDSQLRLWQDEQLIILNCDGIDCESMVRALSSCHKQIKASRSALVNVNPRCLDDLKAVWPIVSGIFYENIEPDMFLKGLDHVLKGGLWLPRSVMEALLITRSTPPPSWAPERDRQWPKLTRRELQILEKISQGCANEVIAEKLFLSKHTIKSHLYNIYKKINAKNRLEAANWLKRYYEEHH